MSTKNRTSQHQQRQRLNRRAQAAVARHQARRRKQIIAVVAAVVVLGIVAALVFAGGDDGDTDLASDSSTTTVKAAGSVKGKPCVAMKGDLPPGAPEVPVRTGKPPTALVLDDLKEGTGTPAAAGDTVTVNYIGVSCSTGVIFDSSYARQEPATFPLSNVIPGWQKGIPGMKVGGQRLLGIPPEDGYGPNGSGESIAPDETLWFVVELLDAKPAG